MTLGGTDLNLLVALEALLEEGSVTRAGRRLGMSQPAMSAALAKLRRRFGDELLVPAGRGYEPTPFARELLPDLRHTVELMHRALRVEDAFNPETEERTFHVAMSDYAAATILGPMLALLAAEAPRVHLVLEPLDAGSWGTRHALADLDALLAPDDLILPGQRRLLWRDRVVLLARRDHPRLVDGRLSADDLSRTPLLAVSLAGGATPQITALLRDAGIPPRPTLEATGFLALPFLVAGSDLVAALPEMLARRHTADDPELVAVEVPTPEVIRVREAIWFAETRLASPAHRWLLNTFERAARTL